MRLANLKGFELRPELWDLKDPDKDCLKKCRLVAFSADQANPVYISEEFAMENSGPLSLNKVSFKNVPCYRSFRLVFQLWASVPDWCVKDQWDLDLRLAKPQLTPRNQPPARLTVYTETGLIPLSHTPDPEGKNNKPVPNNDSVEEGGLEIGDQQKGDESLISRWLPWGRPGINGSTGKSEAGPLSSNTSLSYPTLVDLWTLQHSLDEARAASLEISEQIENMLPSPSITLTEKETVLNKRLKRLRKNIVLVRQDIEKRRYLATNNRYFQKSLNTKLLDSTLDVESQFQRRNESKCTLSPDLTDKILMEQGRLATELLEIFPIDLVGDGKFHFAINGLMLPSVFAINHYDTVQIGAALGFVAQVVMCLSTYLDIGLPYPITVYGSQSYITDNITRIKHGSNKFPLWTRGALLYRVEYALYLLHKDIEQLMNSLNLAVADLKQTLANLKNVLLVLSSEYTNRLQLT